MYQVFGIDHRGRESERLEYESLDEALQKVRDLIEADEIDNNGPMFRSYGMAIHPMPQGPSTEEGEAEMQMPSFVPPPPPDDEGPKLRLRRE